MATIKELRIEAGLNQSVVAGWIRATVPQISGYENGVSLPPLEDMVLLQKKFGQRIDWRENLTPRRKHETVQALIELSERYPVESICEFCARMFRRETSPDLLICFYAEASTGYSEEPLPPTGHIFRTK